MRLQARAWVCYLSAPSSQNTALQCHVHVYIDVYMYIRTCTSVCTKLLICSMCTLHIDTYVRSGAFDIVANLMCYAQYTYNYLRMYIHVHVHVHKN